LSRLDIHINNYKIGKYQNTSLLHKLDLTIEKGKIIGLLGRNGCGKTTLMNVIFGKFKADAIAHFNGNPIQLSHHLKHQLVAYLPQDPFLIGSGTVVDAVQMWFPDPVDQDKILYEPLIHKVHHVKVNALSMGERRFLELLLVIHSERPFILLDEPFSMIGPIQIERVQQIITQVKPCKGMVMSDHYYDKVLEMADESFILKDATLIPVAAYKDLKNSLYL
jgi:ABC-type multidrug transport system ATPase subunit